MRLLVAESEPPAAREKRRESVGRSSGETYIATLRQIVPQAEFHRVKPADRNAALPDQAALADFDAVFVAGSPLHLWQDGPEIRQELEFMRAVFASKTPASGSCAGLRSLMSPLAGRSGRWGNAGKLALPGGSWLRRQIESILCSRIAPRRSMRRRFTQTRSQSSRLEESCSPRMR